MAAAACAGERRATGLNSKSEGEKDERRDGVKKEEKVRMFEGCVV